MIFKHKQCNILVKFVTITLKIHLNAPYRISVGVQCTGTNANVVIPSPKTKVVDLQKFNSFYS